VELEGALAPGESRTADRVTEALSAMAAALTDASASVHAAVGYFVDQKKGEVNELKAVRKFFLFEKFFNPPYLIDLMENFLYSFLKMLQEIVM
jgi:hypothetical protein